MPPGRNALRLAGAGVCLCAAFAAAPAKAACFAGTTGVNFGAYDTQAPGALDAAGTLYLLCDRNEPSATISIGTGQSGSYAARTMTNGPDLLQYNLFTTAARMQVWGNGTGGTGTVSVSPRRWVLLSVPTYGRIPALQNVRARTYNDTLIVTIEY